MHYYQFNIGDYASHTARLSPMEDLAYRRCLDLYYLNERPLNGCSTDVAREIGLPSESESVSYILNKFFVRDGDLWRQKRADLEIKQYQGKREKASKAGIASGKARAGAASEQSFNGRSTDVQQESNERATKQETRNKKQETLKDMSEPEFERFWAESGIRKDGKKNAILKYNKALKESKLPADEFTSLLINDCRSRLEAGQLGFDKKLPATYLHGRDWESPVYVPDMESVISAYHKSLPNNPPVVNLSQAARRQIVDLWVGRAKGDIEFFGRYFGYCSQFDKIHGNNYHTIDRLTNEQTFSQVINGSYGEKHTA